MAGSIKTSHGFGVAVSTAAGLGVADGKAVEGMYYRKIKAACAGATVTCLTMTPFDVVKARLQVRSTVPRKSVGRRTVSMPMSMPIFAQPKLNACCFLPCGTVRQVCTCAAEQPKASLARTVRQIVKLEGVGALWRGTVPSLAMNVPGQAMYMVGYDKIKNGIVSYVGDDYSIPASMVSGCLSRTLVATVTSPVELVRTNLQANVGSTIGQTVGAIRREGGRALWRGLPATLMRDVPFSSVYWMTYESLSRMSGGRGMGSPSAGSSRDQFLVSFSHGCVSGCIAAAITNPFDVAKTRTQAVVGARTGGTVEIMRQVIRFEGVAGLWAGLSARLLKIGPACGIMIGSYEALSWYAAGRD